MNTTRPTIPADALPGAARGRPGPRPRRRLRRHPRRGRGGHALPGRLSGHADGTPDDAGHPGDRRLGPGRAAPRGDAGPILSAGGRGPAAGRHLGRDGGPARARRLDGPRCRGIGSAPDRASPTTSRPAISCASRSAWQRPRFELASPIAGPPPDRQGRRRDRAADRGGPRRRSRRRPDRRRPAGRPDRGGRGARGPRAARRRGSRRGPLRDRRLRAELRLAPPRGVGARHRRRRADRARHRRHDRRLRVGHHAHAVGHRRRPGQGSRRAVPAPVRRAAGRAGGRRRRPSGRGSRPRRSTRPRAGPIEAEGFGEAFFHRTGHGIGLEGHEEPYIIAGNGEPLRPGMAFSVEPGIYLVGEYGARIEDIVVCGPDGPIALNEAPRELYVVDG